MLNTKSNTNYTNNKITHELFEKQTNEEFWNNYISKVEDNYLDLTGLLKLDKKNTKLGEYKHILDTQELEMEITDKLYRDIKELNQKHGIMLNAILQYVWHKVLSVYGDSKTTVVGTTVSGRNWKN